MNSESRLLDWLVKESFSRRDFHPALKRMVLRAVLSSLRKNCPESYAEKCHGAALALYMILRTLRIRSTICGGTVSWLFGGIDMAGTPWQTKCGFWTPNPEVPTPHAWLITEFGGHVDLTCSFFHMTYSQNLQDSQQYDLIPMIWTKSEHLATIPNLQYKVLSRFGTVDLNGCDELARQTVGQALTDFWGDRAIDILLQTCTEPEALISQLHFPDLNDDLILDGPSKLDILRDRNSWVARNCSAPAATMLARPPGY